MESLLSVGKSTIAGAGVGVFAIRDIPAGTRICEYTGRECSLAEDRTDMTYTYVVDQDHVIVGDGISSKINDSVDFRQLSYDETVTFFTQKGLPYLFPHNCKFTVEHKKVYVDAIANIAPGQELFADYGFKYWAIRVLRMRFVDYRYPVEQFRF